MKAVWFEQGDIGIKEVPVPKPGPGEALIRITAAGICNTDHEILKGYIPGFRGIPGHEFSGVVERSSSGRLENTRVTGEINIPCGSCSMCARGLGRHCAERTVLGIQNRNGVFAEYTTLPEENLFPLPPKISDEEGVFIEPLAAAFEILEQIEVTKGEEVLIIGDGKLGLLCGVALSDCECSLCISGKHRNKLETLSGLGVSGLLSGDIGADRKWDTVIEASGSPSGLDTALSHVKPRGRIVLKSTFAEKSSIDFSSVVVNEISLIGSRCGRFHNAVEYMEKGEFDFKTLITDTYGLQDFKKGFDRSSDKDSIKIIIKP